MAPQENPGRTAQAGERAVISRTGPGQGRLAESALSPRFRISGPVRDLSGRTATVDQQQEQLRQTIAAQQARQEANRAEQDDLLRAAESARAAVEAELKQLQSIVKQQQAAAASTRARLEAIQQELHNLQQASPSDGSDSKSAQEKLQQEAARLTQYLSQVEGYLESVSPSLAALEQKRNAAAQQEIRVRRERKRVLDEDSARLRELQKQMQTSISARSALTRNMSDALSQLGAQVLQSGMTDPSIAAEINKVRELDSLAEQHRRALAASMAETDAMPSWTMPLFVGTVAGAPLLLVTLVVAGFLAFNMWQDGNRLEQVQEQARQAAPPAVNPYLQHPLKDHVAYRIADRLAVAREASNIKQARIGLYGICRELHLGIYRANGSAVLRGCERSSEDFFLLV